ncbi:MAG: glycosyltransferase family 2 protein [Pseudomonadota bacterium]
MPTVSVIMPAFRASKTIREAVDSVLAQRFQDFELLVVEDGCPERSGEIALQAQDPRVRLIRQANRGLAGARNTGIAAADGRYIALLDSDDRWMANKLERHVALLDREPQVGVSYSASALIGSDGRPLGLAQRPRLKRVTPARVFCRNPVGNGSAAVIRREVFDQIAFHRPEQNRPEFFDETFRQSEDIECWVRIALTTPWEFRGIGEQLTAYRIAESGLSADVIKQFDSWQQMVEHARRIDPVFTARYESVARAYQLRYLARRLVAQRDGGFASQLMAQALRCHPAMIAAEPVKTTTTLAACLALKVLRDSWYVALERLVTGSRGATS